MADKMHVSLHVKDLEESVRFYSTLFGSQPAKVKPGYAKFDAETVVLSLEHRPGDCGCICGLSHLGIRVSSTAEVLAARARLQAAGLAFKDEMNTNCCYALQDKIWLTDPTGYRWEIYTVKQDTDQYLGEKAKCECA
jgi:catechol 2,3-dioxygenase-like lactoylglutathione lyase family enzyme